MNTEYDLIVIGAGPGGYEIAARRAAAGERVLLVERDLPGGTCLNRGCIPTKCYCASAAAYATVVEAPSLGVNVTGVTVDFSAVAARKDAVVAQLRSGIMQMLSQVTFVEGTAELKPGRVVSVKGTDYTAVRILIATGSQPAVSPIEGAQYCLTSDTLLQLTELPESMVIIGGGVIGMEFAWIFSTLGTQVTVVEFAPEILPAFDSEVAKRLRTRLSRKGIKFHLSSRVTRISADGTVEFTGKRGADSVKGSAVLMAVGRKPVVPPGCAEAGVELTQRGAIRVDEHMRTTAPGIFAAGDCTGLCMLAHAASAQARVALGEKVNLDIIPSAVFTQPELAQVGLTADLAQAAGHKVSIHKSNFASNGKALAMADTEGLVKVVTDEDSGVILGMTIMGPHAADLITEAAALIYAGIPASEAAERLIHGHPTLSETVQKAME
ncbi:MAG: dihydrolipoyl dehydrogenase [Muribaculaceae bacterium]|nr:dihydrolipoyl dehydrogenase [Muribaculaceae bacterium]